MVGGIAGASGRVRVWVPVHAVRESDGVHTVLMDSLVSHDCVVVADTPTEEVSLLLAVREAVSGLVCVQLAVGELVAENAVCRFDAESDVVSVCCALSVGTALSSVRENKMLRRGVQSVVPAVLVMYSAGMDAAIHDPRKYCRVGSGSAPARNDVIEAVALYVQVPMKDVEFVMAAGLVMSGT
jgi:hypothetical protein